MKLNAGYLVEGLEDIQDLPLLDEKLEGGIMILMTALVLVIHTEGIQDLLLQEENIMAVAADTVIIVKYLQKCTEEVLTKGHTQENAGVIPETEIGLLLQLSYMKPNNQ